MCNNGWRIEQIYFVTANLPHVPFFLSSNLFPLQVKACSTQIFASNMFFHKKKNPIHNSYLTPRFFFFIRKIAIQETTCLLTEDLPLHVINSILSSSSVLPPTFFATTSKTVSRAPRLIGCVFLNRANVTCHWDAGDTPALYYTLEVERRPTL